MTEADPTSTKPVPASAIASFDGLEALTQKYFAARANSGSAAYEFNSGMRGLHARYAGAELSMAMLRVPDLVGSVQGMIRRTPVASVLVDTHVSTFLFSAWSSIECLAYAVNALGCAVSRSEFRDIDSGPSLRGIGPHLIYGKKPLPGFATHFPELTACLRSHRKELDVLQEQHNVSKHRRAVTAGGVMNRQLQKLLKDAVGEELGNRLAFNRAGWEDILLDPEPNVPLVLHDAERDPLPLDALAAAYRGVVHRAGHAIGADLECLAATVQP